MRRKHNPLVSLAALVLLATILVLVCTGCGAEAADKVPDRFTIETATNNGKGHQHTLIITDTETGVQYLYFKSMYSGGLVVLQPGEG